MGRSSLHRQLPLMMKKYRSMMITMATEMEEQTPVAPELLPLSQTFSWVPALVTVNQGPQSSRDVDYFI